MNIQINLLETLYYFSELIIKFKSFDIYAKLQSEFYSLESIMFLSVVYLKRIFLDFLSPSSSSSSNNDTLFLILRLFFTERATNTPDLWKQYSVRLLHNYIKRLVISFYFKHDKTAS